MITERWDNDRITVASTWTDTCPVECLSITIEPKPGVNLRAQDLRFPFGTIYARANDQAWLTDPRRNA